MESIENAIGYRFQQPALIAQAVTHPSARNENTTLQDNQRMEYLGDAALGLVAAEYFYRHFPQAPEGTLTKLRSQTTSTQSLAEIAVKIDLGSQLVLGRGEEGSGGRTKKNSLADTLEAVLGAAYLDGGLSAVSAIFHHIFVPHLAEVSEVDIVWNPKGELQEWAQQKGYTCPTYTLLRQEGPSHERIFTIEVKVQEHCSAQGTGPNKRAAEMEAASRLLNMIRTTPP